jgi:hypothetical protein
LALSLVDGGVVTNMVQHELMDILLVFLALVFSLLFAWGLIQILDSNRKRKGMPCSADTPRRTAESAPRQRLDC